MRAALDWWSFHNSLARGRLDTETMIRRAVELGAGLLSLEYYALPAAWRRDPARLLSLRDEFKIEYVLSCAVPVPIPAAAWHLTTASRRRFLEFAHRLHVATVRFPLTLLPATAARTPLPWDWGGRFAVRRLAPRLRRLCERAADHGLTVAAENHGDFDPASLLDLLAEVDRPNLALAINTAHSLRRGEDPYRACDALAPHAAIVLLGDAHGHGASARPAPLGEGRLCVAEIRRLLVRQRYAGPVAVRVDLPPWRAALEDEWARRGFVAWDAAGRVVEGEVWE